MNPAVESLRAAHRIQDTKSSCVAACFAILRRLVGGDGAERTQYPAIFGEFVTDDLAIGLDILSARIARGVRAIIAVRGPAWMNLARSNNRKSPYGDIDDGNHAVVIVQVAQKRRFVILDPWFEASVQPMLCSRDELASAWTGEVRFVTPEEAASLEQVSCPRVGLAVLEAAAVVAGT